MRLRDRPWAVRLVSEHPENVLQSPNPEIRIEWEKRFEDFSRPLEVEIGSGRGQFITTLTQKHLDRNYVAIELQTTTAGIILRTKLGKKLDNLQVSCGDTISIANFLAENSVDVSYLNFSDPWPETRHEKRRLTYKGFLKNYETVLKPTGHLEFKTNNSGLFSHNLMNLSNYGMTFDLISVDLHHESEEIVAKNIKTEYEHKSASKGSPIYALHAHFS